MSTNLRHVALVLALATAALPLAAHADNQSANGNSASDSKNSSAITIDELNKEFKSLSPEARNALMHELETRGVAGISGMNQDQARQAFGGLSPNVRTELQAKWDSLSDEQRDAIKQLGPDAVKKMFADRIKEAIKPPQAVVDAGQAVVEKSKAFVDKVKAFWAKLTGGADAEQPAQANANGG
jgi:hypothetical protein